MKRFLLAIPVLATVFMACQQQPSVIQNNLLGSLEVNLSTTGANSARFTQGLQTQGTLRESDVVFTNLNTAVVSTDGAHDYLQAQFTIQNTSLTAFNNLTLYAVAKSGNIAGTAIKTITSFGSNTTLAEQTRVAKIITPTHGLQFSSGTLSMVTSREDFQAFEQSEVTTLQTDFNNNLSGFSSADKALGYGFVARRCIPNCTSPTSFTRDLPASNTNGLVTIALRIPKQGASTSYNFRMTFAVVNETTTRVTRGLYPPETLANAEGRQASGEVMQIGLSRAASQSSIRTNKGIDQVLVSSDPTDGNASYTALGLGRFSSGGSSTHTCALTASGVAYCWGQGTQGQLGTNTTLSDQKTPVKVQDSNGQPSPLRFSSISVGGLHACAITINGVAYCWGRTDFGRLGNNVAANSIQGYPIPVQDSTVGNPSPLRFSSISAGGNFTCGLTTDGVAYCWGRGSSGQQGNADTTDQLYPQPVLVAANTPSSLRFSNISVGSAHTCAITTAGVAYCWGRAINGELGNYTDLVNKNLPVIVKDSAGNPSALRFSSISVGTSHTCGLTTTNVAYCWGSSFQGQLGDGQSGNSSIDRNTPFAVSVSLNTPSALRFSSISAGSSHTCALTTDGVAYCWGLATFGRLGNNDIAIANYSLPELVRDSVIPANSSPLRFSSIHAASSHTCALTTDGMSYCWGNALLGRLGNNDDINNKSTPSRDTASFKL